MPNSYFQFKEFIVQQNNCAMKVCTDACLFGAWVAKNVSGFQFPVYNCLDLGTGTGLLSLMFAQKNANTNIDAVEIDEAAATQAKENFNNSPWNERLVSYNNSIRQFASATDKLYDVIISNPPFYNNDLKSATEKRNIALHNDEFSFEELLYVVKRLLKNDSNFFVLLPYHRKKEFEELALKNNLFILERVFIKQTPKHTYFRCMICISKSQTETIQSEIVIKNEENEYSKEFKKLLSDYYLNL